MRNTLNRVDYSEGGIFGQFFFENDSLPFCVTLEHSFNGVPVVPLGVFNCVRGVHRLSDGVAFETFEITGIDGHSGLLFHAGNFNDDSHGCVLLGESRAINYITNSRKKFNDFMMRLQGIDQFQIEVKNGY